MTAMKKCLFLLVFTATLFLSCSERPSFSRQPDSTTIVYLDEFDSEIVRIAETARSTLAVFLQHLNSPESGESDFYIKYAFRLQPSDNAGIYAEQIWISITEFSNGRFYGIVASTPIYLAHIQSEDKIYFYADSIVDWMFIQNGRIVGGESIRHLLTQIPEDERSGSQRRTLEMFDWGSTD